MQSDYLAQNKIFLQIILFRFGFKFWAICSADGYLLHAEPYCGSSTLIPKILGCQGPDVVLGLVEKAQIVPGTQVFFDNLFTSMPLLSMLSDKGIFCEKLFIC